VASILIAEDEVQIAAFIAKGLQRAGYQTQIATDGGTALTMALSGQFDLVLLDLGLPGIDGWSVLVELKAQSDDPPIIIVTAMDGNEERRQSFGLGAADYITKPFRFNKLLDSIHCQIG